MNIQANYMTDNEWKISVEKKLTSIQKDIEFIKTKLPRCEKVKIKSMIKTNRWLVGILFTMGGAIIGSIITKV